MNPEQFKTEVLPLRSKLLGIARKMLDNEQDCEDAVQEALLKLWSLGSVEHCDNLAAFATTVVKNLCIDKCRVQKKMLRIDDTSWQPTANEDPYQKLEQKNTTAILHWIIEQLPTLQKKILKMKDIEEYEVDEIAQITGSNAEAVRMNLSRARKKVREEYLKWMSFNHENQRK